jgi:hypothetical protein
MKERYVKPKNSVRICVDIPTEMHQLIKEYNEKTTRPVSLPRVCMLAIEKEVDLIKKELAEKENSDPKD